MRKAALATVKAIRRDQLGHILQGIGDCRKKELVLGTS